jgi:hypothetical protein
MPLVEPPPNPSPAVVKMAMEVEMAYTTAIQQVDY